jgi:serine/threonine-protein kinase
MPSAPKAPVPKAPDVKIGDVVLERYRVVEQIGSGGHSVVFRGTDERLQRPVCIKVFSGLGGETGVGRTSYEHFVQEAFALSRLTHPNTLRIYDFGHLGPKDAAGMPLQVCEYMNGGTLSQVVREQGKQPLPEAVRITGAMCSALAEAHGLGIVHRDIKPQNILFGSVGPTRLPKLADFGIAKWSVDDDHSKDNIAEDTAIVAGQKLAMYSPSWAAPEQLAGQAVQPSTDIYSLAVVAIYMISGKAIFADEDVYAGYKKRRHAEEHVREALVPLGVPRAVIDVLSRALAFDPKRRLSKVDELSAELLTAIEPATEEQPRLPPSAPRKSRPQEAAPPAVPLTPTSPQNAITPPGGEPVIKHETNITAEATNPMGNAPQPARQQQHGQPQHGQPQHGQPQHGQPQHGQPQGPVTVPLAADPTPQTFHAPAAQPWMSVTPKASGTQAVRVPLADTPTLVGNRRVHFVMVGQNTADIAGSHGTKVRVTLLAGPGGQRVVHIKGLTCFVAHLGGRPSPAVTLTQTSDIALVTPRAQEIGHLRVAQGTSETGYTLFQVGADLLAVGAEDCADPILFDFGPGSDAYFVYTRGRTVPKVGRRG